MSFHIGAKKNEIADIVLLPGDPLRAQHIAENYLQDIKKYNTVRNMLGFTGYYEDLRISVQGAGMGLPSTAIYVNELIREYGVKTLIRMGTAGSIQENIHIGDVILAMSASTDSNMNKIKFNGLDFAPVADFKLLHQTYQIATNTGIPLRVGGVLSTDTFYSEAKDRYDIWSRHGVLAVEMESTALYTLAAAHQVSALTVLTISDHLLTGKVATSEERENNIDVESQLVLNTLVSLR